MCTFLKDEEFLPAACKLIANAKKSVYVSSFKVEVTTKRRGEKLLLLFAMLRRLHDEGKDVRILTNQRDNRGHVPESNAYALRYFKEKKIPCRILPNARLVHAKTLIVDRQKAILGSHNLSVKSCHNNLEISFSI